MERIQQGLAGTGAPGMNVVESTVVTPPDPPLHHTPWHGGWRGSSIFYQCGYGSSIFYQCGSGSRFRILMTKNWKNFQLNKNYMIKNCNILIPRPP
jgi:hypothetical protein